MRDPESVGVIPDGNRRYARKVGVPFYRAYALGVKRAREALDFVVEETRTKNIVFYTLSLENVRRRSKEELSFLFRLFEREMRRVLENNPWDARISFVGRLSELPDRIRRLAERVERKTEENGGPNVVLAVAYTGIAEVVDAVNKLVEMGKKIGEGELLSHLYVPFPLDLVLRTSGEQRLSGFFPLQASYAEFVFYPKLWPEMTRADFRAVYEEYRGRERRFGR